MIGAPELRGKLGWPAAAAVVLILVLGALDLSATAYGRYAEARLDRLPDPGVQAAAALATAFSPWSAQPAALHGWILAQGGSRDEAIAAYLRALRWAPADALLWAEYAQALARMEVFDERMTWATRRALELAPSSPAVRDTVATMGLAYWRRGEEALHDLWRQSIRWQLDHSRGSFLSAVEGREQRGAFCLRYAAALGEAAWCRPQE